jgi:hypothetical protein
MAKAHRTMAFPYVATGPSNGAAAMLAVLKDHSRLAEEGLIYIMPSTSICAV